MSYNIFCCLDYRFISTGCTRGFYWGFATAVPVLEGCSPWRVFCLFLFLFFLKDCLPLLLEDYRPFCLFRFITLFASNSTGDFDLRTLRAVRVLRPLKLVSGIPSMYYITCTCAHVTSSFFYVHTSLPLSFMCTRHFLFCSQFGLSIFFLFLLYVLRHTFMSTRHFLFFDHFVDRFFYILFIIIFPDKICVIVLLFFLYFKLLINFEHFSFFFVFCLFVCYKDDNNNNFKHWFPL
jgi:hypothetical protein